MSIELEILEAERVIRWLDGAIHGVEFQQSTRSMLAAACFDTVGELNKGVIWLQREGLNAPSFALARSVFETHVRGLWLSHCATDSDLARFQRDKINSSFTEMIAAIERIPQFSDGILERARVAGFDAMSSYTHGGFSQISRRIGADFIEPHYPEEERIEVIRFSTSFALLSAIQVAGLADNQTLAESTLERLVSYCGDSA